jgi:hypothetical protein
VAIGRGAHRLLGTQHAARAGAVVDDDGLAEARLHPLGRQPRPDIGRAARWKGHDEADGPIRRPALRGGEARKRERGGEKGTAVRHGGRLRRRARAA